MAETEFQKLRKQSPRMAFPSDKQYSPEILKARKAEINRRNIESRRRAAIVLAHRYPEEYRALVQSEAEGLAFEKGPLPGDEKQEG